MKDFLIVLLVFSGPGLFLSLSFSLFVLFWKTLSSMEKWYNEK